MVGVFIFCLRVMCGIALANDVPRLEDVNGVQWIANRSDPTTYVYSDRDNSESASRVGKVLANSGQNVVAVADVRGLNFWPANAIVMGAIAQQAKRNGNNIVLDWTGAWGNMMGIPAGGCSVVVTDGKKIMTTTDCSVVIKGSVNIK